MNYLAHAYLSFNHPETLVGNMISDFVKGKTKFSYPAGIQIGIELHRYIDRFTDEHEATKEAKEIFRPAYRLYSGAFVDVVYDHFLAADEREFSEQSLLFFTRSAYNMLDEHFHHLPERFSRMLPYMKEQNWLFHYRTRWGTEKSLGGLVRRAAYLTESDTAFRLFEQHYQLFQDCYRHFWADVKPFAKQQFDVLCSLQNKDER
ncbi:MAG TPA: ACP phosphodiesterase [Chitinophagaceae bacterium]|jgi:acyl carrier protein phosphodiesterase|nr:ACP phosphodiesterase [Chitinophagaceae bacterium]HMU59284.1 ACP phosphodiesterase [Chitinophagaceae bacterium]